MWLCCIKHICHGIPWFEAESLVRLEVFKICCFNHVFVYLSTYSSSHHFVASFTQFSTPSTWLPLKRPYLAKTLMEYKGLFTSTSSLHKARGVEQTLCTLLQRSLLEHTKSCPQLCYYFTKEFNLKMVCKILLTQYCA